MPDLLTGAAPDAEQAAVRSMSLKSLVVAETLYSANEGLTAM